MRTNNRAIVDDLKTKATGRWPEILTSLGGIDPAILDGKHHPCPRCGGTDRFRSIDPANGVLFCNQCFSRKNGDGMAALCWACEWSFARTMRELASFLGDGNLPSPDNGQSRAKTVQGKRARPYRTMDDAITAVAAKQAWTLVGQWLYRDGDGQTVAAVLRFDDSRRAGHKPTKTFRPISRHTDGWRIGDPPGLWPLYGLKDLPADGAVYVVEGEGCADALRSLGLTAVTSAHGAKSARKTDWSPLAARDLLMIPDNDAAGESYADDIVSISAELDPPAALRIVRLPGLPAGGDVVDWIKAHEDTAKETICHELEQLAQHACVENATHRPRQPPRATNSPQVPKMICLAQVRPEQVQWLWPGRIAQGKLTLLAGDPGLGKSFLTLDLAARVSVGASWPDGIGDAPLGGVVLLGAEDDLADTIRPRLDRAGADVDRIHSIEGVRAADDKSERSFDLARDLPALEVAIRKTGDCRLVVIDPLTAFLGNTDSHRNADVRALLKPLSDLAAKYCVAIVAVTHLNKSSAVAAIYRAMGSLAFIAAARAAWFVARCGDDPNRRLFLPAKNNLGGDASGLAFSIVDGKVVWEAGAIMTPIDKALAQSIRKRGPPPKCLPQAIAYLAERLANGPLRADELMRDGFRQHISKRTLKRAKLALKVASTRDSPTGPWFWRLPNAQACGDEEFTNSNQLGPLGTVANDPTKSPLATNLTCQGAEFGKCGFLPGETAEHR